MGLDLENPGFVGELMESGDPLHEELHQGFQAIDLMAWLLSFASFATTVHHSFGSFRRIHSTISPLLIRLHGDRHLGDS